MALSSSSRMGSQISSPSSITQPVCREFGQKGTMDLQIVSFKDVVGRERSTPRLKGFLTSWQAMYTTALVSDHCGWLREGAVKSSFIDIVVEEGGSKTKRIQCKSIFGTPQTQRVICLQRNGDGHSICTASTGVRLSIRSRFIASHQRLHCSPHLSLTLSRNKIISVHAFGILFYSSSIAVRFVVSYAGSWYSSLVEAHWLFA